MGLHTMLEGDDAKLEGVAKISKASSIATQELLSRFFPSDSGFVPNKCTVMDMGAGFGGTARVAAKELGCKVPETFRFSCSLLSPFGGSSNCNIGDIVRVDFLRLVASIFSYPTRYHRNV